jgi:glutamine amidotransferase
MLEFYMEYLLIDYGVSNTKSVERALLAAGFNGSTVQKIQDFQPSKDTLIVLPGVGSFDQGMQNLKQRHWDELIQKELKDNYWILGICLGFQLLGDGSNEGELKGLGLLPHKCVSVAELQKNKKNVNTGWRIIEKSENASHYLDKYFYFTHSFAFNFSELSKNTGIKNLSLIRNSEITSNLIYNKCIGIQFHPEKSHEQGIQILSEIGKYIHV